MSGNIPGWGGAGRVLIVLSCLAVGLFSLAAAAGEILAVRQPGTALKLFPWSADAKAQLAGEMVLDGSPDVDAARRLALSSLARKPANAPALRVLGIVASDVSRATALFRLSERMSRRDTATQLALIEIGVEAGDIAAVLRHYDRTMQVRPQMVNVLMPVLAAASADAPVRDEVGRVLRDRPFWWGQYLGELARKGTSASAIESAVGAIRLDPAIQSEAAALSAALYRLATLGAWDAMARIGQRYCSGPNCAAVPANGGFEQAPRLMPLDWIIADDPAGSAIEPDPAGNGSVLALRGAGGRGAARQLLFLRAGPHRLSMRFGGTPGAANTPMIGIACTDGRAILSSRADGAPRWGAALRVPADCPAQWLTIIPYALDLEGDGAVLVDDVRIIAGEG